MRILAELQSNGRITNVELSRRAKITAPPCLRRMRTLEKAGYIKGYHADLDAKSLGYEVTGFAFVGLASQAEADLKRFEEQVKGWPNVRECQMLSGEVDFLLKCVAKVFGLSVLHHRDADGREGSCECEDRARHPRQQERARRSSRCEVTAGQLNRYGCFRIFGGHPPRSVNFRAGPVMSGRGG